MEKVTATLENTTVEANVTAYDLTVEATGDNGESTKEKRELYITSQGIFPLKFIAAKYEGEEIDYVKEENSIDIDIGNKNDFEIKMDRTVWKKEKYWYNNRIFIPGTEYGGIIKDIEVDTEDKVITLRGPTWRGMMEKKVVRPPDGQNNLILNGELNAVVRELFANRFDGLFKVSNVETEVVVSNWAVDRYVTLYDAIQKLLDNYNYRLNVAYVQPDGLDYGYVEVAAVPVKDYSDDIEYSEDGNVEFVIRDCRSGVNHLVCAGEGQNQERVVIDLYVQEDGNIGKTQFYFGADEVEEVYTFTSADAAKLEEDGTKKLLSLKNYKKIEVTVDDMDLELGDIVGGYEDVTGTQIKQPVIQKILKVTNGTTTIDYKVQGDD